MDLCMGCTRQLIRGERDRPNETDLYIYNYIYKEKLLPVEQRGRSRKGRAFTFSFCSAEDEAMRAASFEPFLGDSFSVPLLSQTLSFSLY